MRRTHIIDHRGQLYTICQPADLPERASRALRDRVRKANEHRLRYLWLAMAPMGVDMLIGMLFSGSSLDLPVVLIMLALVFGVALLVALPLARRRARGAARLCLEAGLCPACGYIVADLATEADGCVVCPECGAAWGRAPMKDEQ